MKPAAHRGGRVMLLLFACALLATGTPGPRPAAAQAEPPPPASDTLPPPAEPDVTPGGAFLRSLLLPGWGHAVTGAHLRGAFYVAAQSGSGWMLAKSLARRSEAREMRATELRIAEERLRAAGVVSPDTIRIRARENPRVEEWDELIDARSQQVEDWLALSVFLVLLGATDAFVAGHLMDRPEPLTIEIGPTPGGRWEVRGSVRPGWPRSPP